MSDLIKRADAIEAMGEEPLVWLDTAEEWAEHDAWVLHVSALKALPSAESVHIETYRELYEKYVELKHASAEAVQGECGMIPIELKKRYPYSRDEDITDAFMRGYQAHGEAVQGGRYESAMQKLREMPRYLNGVRAKQIKKIPPEAVQGEWVKEIHHHKDDEQEFDYYDIHCSVCGAKPQKSWALTNYCPDCGAKMHKGGGEE